MNTIINKYLLAAQYNEEQCQWISQIQIDNHNMNTMINIYDISSIWMAQIYNHNTMIPDYTPLWKSERRECELQNIGRNNGSWEFMHFNSETDLHFCRFMQKGKSLKEYLRKIAALIILLPYQNVFWKGRVYIWNIKEF